MATPIDDEILALKNRLRELRKEKQREHKRQYFQRPEVKEKQREYMREYMRKYCRRPEVKEKQREYMREYSQRPEVKEKQREYMRQYFCRPEVKEKKREYFQRPEVKLAAKLRRNGIPEEVIKAELSRLKEAAE